MSDYLWDKSGEADPEVERLEELLGTLSHRPRDGELPEALLAHLRPRPLSHWSELAAAAILILMGLAGLWMGLERLDARAEISAVSVQDITPAPAQAEVNHIEAREARRDNRSKALIASARLFRRRPPIGGALDRDSTEQVRQLNAPANEPAAMEAMSAEEIAEAKRAREELLIALQVASSKLNHAQRRAQNPNNTNPDPNR